MDLAGLAEAWIGTRLVAGACTHQKMAKSAYSPMNTGARSY
jgi:hypothetical protein